MTIHEKEGLVRLDEERDFGTNYLKLLEVRFPDAIHVHVDVRQEDLQSRLVPCSVQILFENAIKHNAFSKEEPLDIYISSEKGWLTIRNNIRPRTSPAPSTGVGLHYIQSRYQDISERDIEIIRDGEHFTVRVPLLD